MTRRSPKLHKKQQELLEILKNNSDHPLTIMELKEEANFSSTSIVHHHIRQLEKKGYLRRNPSNPKDYRILTDSPDAYVAYINLYGLAQCGPNGTILDGDPVDRIKLESRLLGFPSEEAFAVQAKGDSMWPHIKPGDIVIAQIVKDQNEVDGKIVVCINDEKAIIKKVTFASKEVILSSFKEGYEPFSAASDFRPEGIVRGILSRSFG